MKQLIDWRGRVIPSPWLPLADIPNRATLLVTVLLNNGSQVKTKVRRSNTTGLHTLIGVRVADALAWQPRTRRSIT